MLRGAGPRRGPERALLCSQGMRKRETLGRGRGVAAHQQVHDRRAAGTRASFLVVCLVLAAAASVARAEDPFVFKDLDGYEKCLSTDHLVETTNTRGGSQTRFLGQVEIQLRCVEAAVKLVSQTKKKDRIADFIKATKRLSAWVNSLDLIDVLVDVSLPECNEMAYYEVMTKALSMPRDRNVYFTKSRTVVKKCLKNQTFRADFLEEKDSADPDVSENACVILLEEKLVKVCPKKAKP